MEYAEYGIGGNIIKHGSCNSFDLEKRLHNKERIMKLKPEDKSPTLDITHKVVGLGGNPRVVKKKK